MTDRASIGPGDIAAQADFYQDQGHDKHQAIALAVEDALDRAGVDASPA